ncbi:hypothetical protein KSL85_09275 [Klebsiella aerogenes]|uniref:hypothetical protein n=1 Tax=Klebsiella aerogenes TaxID=548 RepID=UPI001C2117C4|nr:hypothetical protein [Klebsiella aerogenes]QXC67599.1 hypothetical protein KSL85_09275 [Klebsiella aerogenes]
MTKSTITRERLEELAAGQSGFNLRIATNEESKELARIALAAMDSEPVAYTDEAELNFVNDMACMWTKGMGINEVPLYRHAQPAPVVPDEVTAEDCPALVKYDVTEVDETWARGFNACRAAMLNGGK